MNIQPKVRTLQRFSIPYLIHLQRLLYIVLYTTKIHIKYVFYSNFYMYIFAIPSNVKYKFYFCLIHYLNHKKWIEEMRENLYI
jgi:hypothetical protein